jgi:hypothetical protein
MIGKCMHCNRKMPAAKSCSRDNRNIFSNGWIYSRALKKNGKGRCPDCGIELRRGNVHHWGCKYEICPICKEPMHSCHCDAFLLNYIPEQD